MRDEKINLLIENLGLRNITGMYFKTFEEAKEKILELIQIDSTVGIGNSVTLKKMNISSELIERGNTVFDKTTAKNNEESKKMKMKSLLADWYISGTNGISVDGHIVNMDHSGNRAAAMIYGPDNVIIVIGKNKISESLEETIFRVRNIASPMNARRAGLNPPCVEMNKCIDCKSKERVCNNLVIIEGQNDERRMIVLIVDEVEGF